MSADKSSIQASKPGSIWLRPVTVDIEKLFVNLTGAVGKALMMDWGKAAKDAAEAITAVGFEKEPGKLAWVLVHRSLTRAIYELVGEAADVIAESVKQEKPAKMDTQFELKLTDFEVDKTLIDHPRNLPIVEEIRIAFRHWLRQTGIKEHKANSIANRLPSYFVYALINDWRSRPADYTPLLEALNSPFSKAGENERAWAAYSAWLQRVPDERMFDESFGIRDVYVPLRAYYVEKKAAEAKAGMEGQQRETEEPEQTVVDIDAGLMKWINDKDRNDAVKVISGGPGSGKSCFAKLFAAKLAEEGLRVLFIPLHLLDFSRELEAAVGKYVKDGSLLPNNPLDADSGERQLIIIFDGLDELSQQGKVGAEIAREFVEEVIRTVQGRNQQECRLQVLISGRELIVQKNENLYRKVRQVYYLLPYYVKEQEVKKFNDPQELLKSDQRHEWWRKFTQTIGLPEAAMPKKLQQKFIDEITAQPLLNYLVALSYRRDKIDFSAEVNLNLVYADLLAAVWERGWEHQQHAATKELKQEEFVRLLEDIGLAAWHGDSRSATINEIEKYAGTDASCLKTFKKGAESGVTRLLTAFYFRRAEGVRAGEETFEFTHKSFGEYLAARRVVRAMQLIDKMNRMKEVDADTVWETREALKRWIEITGPAVMESDLYRYVKNEVQLQGKETAGRWQIQIREMIDHLLRYGMPVERLNPRPDFVSEVRLSRNSEEALLALLSGCSEVTGIISILNWPAENSAGEWINRLRGQRSDWENTLALACLQMLDISNQYLVLIDLYSACLSYTNLLGAELPRADLVYADLEEAILVNTNLAEADLTNANLTGAKLEGADITGTNLESANLLGANLLGADLTDANFKGADLTCANLEGAKLVNADFEGAILRGATLPATVKEIKKITKWNKITIWPEEG